MDKESEEDIEDVEEKEKDEEDPTTLIAAPEPSVAEGVGEIEESKGADD